MKEIMKKLLALQKEIGAIAKDSVNPYFKSKYFDINTLLGTVKPILTQHKVVVLQPLDNDKLKTILVDSDTGEEITSSVLLPQNPDPQKMGSIITYFRRYSLQSLLALEAEDDDANLGANIPSLNPTKPCSIPQSKPTQSNRISAIDTLIEKKRDVIGNSKFMDILGTNGLISMNELLAQSDSKKRLILDEMKKAEKGVK